MIILTILLILSVSINILLIWYIRKLLKTFYFASEAASEIFSRLDSFKQHLKSIYELELFYGDRNLKEIIEHSNDLIENLKKYDNVYSFTQPDLEQILQEEDIIQEDETKDTSASKKI